METKIEIDRFLLQALQMHGLDARLEDGWACLDSQGPALRGVSWTTHRFEVGLGLQLDVHLALPDGRLLTESYGAVGLDEDEALRSCLGKFMRSALHVILSAFYGIESKRIEVRPIQIAGEDWLLHHSHILVEKNHSEESTDGLVPDGALEALIEQIQQRPGDVSEVHWLRSFHGQHANGGTDEVLWDGLSWPELSTTVSALPWAKSDHYYSARSFMLLTRVQTTAATSRQDHRFIIQGVKKLIEAVGKSPQAPDDELFEMLQREGYDDRLAERIVVFTAPGFSYRLFPDQGLPQHFEQMERGDVVACPLLQQEPVFTIAYDLAQEVRQTDQDRFGHNLMRCPLFQALNEALHQGIPLKDVKSAPLKITLGETR